MPIVQDMSVCTQNNCAYPQSKKDEDGELVETMNVLRQRLASSVIRNPAGWTAFELVNKAMDKRAISSLVNTSYRRVA